MSVLLLYAFMHFLSFLGAKEVMSQILKKENSSIVWCEKPIVKFYECFGFEF